MIGHTSCFLIKLINKNTGRENNYLGTRGPNTTSSHSVFSLTDRKTLFFPSGLTFICLHSTSIKFFLSS